MNTHWKFPGIRWIGYSLIAIGLSAPQAGIGQLRNTSRKVAPPAESRVAVGRVMSGRLQLAMMNTKRHLARAKQLTLAAIHENAIRFGLTDIDLSRATAYIDAVDTLILDPALGGLAEVDVEYPGQIRIGPEYAVDLDIDDEVILLLAHELTHVAARDENFISIIDSVAEVVRRTAGVHPTRDQVEDLTCDYIGEQALKQFVRESPGSESIGNRLSETLGYEDEMDEGDEEHLNHEAMLKSWLALDPELESLLPHLSASR
ncbi:MAG: putative metallopeptidase domain protein [Chlorobi bacterium]|nr:putative metallopeptidase domain protein [Chlorobiota bacterium]